MRANWTGMISFGLVNIPVRLYTAARDEKTSFHQIHIKDNGRIGYQKVCKICNQPVEADEIARGYEFKKGKYVIIEDEDLEKISLPSSKSISITSFVNTDELDPVLFDSTSYIGPDDNGEHAYVLLREALKQTGKVGIGKIAMRTREQLVAVRVVEDKLVLQTLHYADELTNIEEIGLPGQDVPLADSEVELSQVLIKYMSKPFDLSAYHDEYEAALKDLIAKKVEGQEIATPAEPMPTNVVDIVSALKASLAASGADQDNKKTA